jgi:hypothetical protein
MLATLPRPLAAGNLRIRQCAPVNKTPRLERTGQSLSTVCKRPGHVVATSVVKIVILCTRYCSLFEPRLSRIFPTIVFVGSFVRLPLLCDVMRSEVWLQAGHDHPRPNIVQSMSSQAATRPQLGCSIQVLPLSSESWRLTDLQASIMSDRLVYACHVYELHRGCIPAVTSLLICTKIAILIRRMCICCM